MFLGKSDLCEMVKRKTSGQQIELVTGPVEIMVIFKVATFIEEWTLIYSCSVEIAYTTFHYEGQSKTFVNLVVKKNCLRMRCVTHV